MSSRLLLHEGVSVRFGRGLKPRHDWDIQMETNARKAHIDLVRIETDTHPLDGLYYSPVGPTRAQAMILHGNCMNFYTGAARFLPERLADLGIATPAFNRRGH